MIGKQRLAVGGPPGPGSIELAERAQERSGGQRPRAAVRRDVLDRGDELGVGAVRGRIERGVDRPGEDLRLRTARWYSSPRRGRPGWSSRRPRTGPRRGRLQEQLQEAGAPLLRREAAGAREPGPNDPVGAAPGAGLGGPKRLARRRDSRSSASRSRAGSARRRATCPSPAGRRGAASRSGRCPSLALQPAVEPGELDAVDVESLARVHVVPGAHQQLVAAARLLSGLIGAHAAAGGQVLEARVVERLAALEEIEPAADQERGNPVSTILRGSTAGSAPASSPRVGLVPVGLHVGDQGACQVSRPPMCWARPGARRGWWGARRSSRGSGSARFNPAVRPRKMPPNSVSRRPPSKAVSR